MKINSPSLVPFDPSPDLTKRIALVISVYQKLGYVNRKSLMETYDLSQLEAGGLMRDFIHAHAKNLVWDLKHAHYTLKT